MKTKKELYDALIAELHKFPMSLKGFDPVERTNTRFGMQAQRMYARGKEIWFEWNTVSWRYATNEKSIKKEILVALCDVAEIPLS